MNKEKELLRKQLELLKQYGYEVVTVKELTEESPFADLGRNDPLFEKLATLQTQRAIVFSDNRLRLSDPMTVGELAMLLSPKEETLGRRHRLIRSSGKAQHAYSGAMEFCREKGINLWVDLWGYDVNHDWPWWHKQVPYFLPYLLG